MQNKWKYIVPRLVVASLDPGQAKIPDENNLESTSPPTPTGEGVGADRHGCALGREPPRWALADVYSVRVSCVVCGFGISRVVLGSSFFAVIVAVAVIVVVSVAVSPLPSMSFSLLVMSM